jgi:hypothetical protein
MWASKWCGAYEHHPVELIHFNKLKNTKKLNVKLTKRTHSYFDLRLANHSLFTQLGHSMGLNKKTSR